MKIFSILAYFFVDLLKYVFVWPLLFFLSTVCLIISLIIFQKIYISIVIN